MTSLQLNYHRAVDEHQRYTTLVGVCGVILTLLCSSVGSPSSVTFMDAPNGSVSTMAPLITNSASSSTSPTTVHSEFSQPSFAITGPRMWRRETLDKTNSQCLNFTEGDYVRKEFYSPNYPHYYPSNTNCVRIITAPSGYLLKLDFRDKFEMEPGEPCRNDYLEVRDGVHGYSNEIGKFCGHNFPPLITSSGRYLWLRFKTDDTIEYSGFRAVYSLVPKPTNAIPEPEQCFFKLEGIEGFANTSYIDGEMIRASVRYGTPIDCVWEIHVETGLKIMLQFPEFKLSKPNECELNFVDVFADQTDLLHRMKNFCGSMADTIFSPTNVLYIRFFADHRAVNSTFASHFTAYRENPKDSGAECLENEYNCEDSTCISMELKCNGRNNCKYRWDETECVETEKTLVKEITGSLHVLIIVIVFCLILIGMCFVFLYNCSRKLIHDHKIIQEHMQQTREMELNTLRKSQTLCNDLIDNKTPILTVDLELHNKEASPTLQKNGLPLKEPSHRSSGYPSIIDNELDELEEAPEMCDSECQTRESLFATVPIERRPSPPIATATKATGPSPTPPPLPAPRTPNFSTFGYPKEPEKKGYKAEAIIEMNEEEPRPFSVHSAKSAPDVIVTH